jgi:hypothetical protein
MTDPASPQPPAPEPKKESGGWCSLLGSILFFLFAGVVVIGASLGFALMGGISEPPLPTPTPVVASPGLTPSASLAATVTPEVLATATPSTPAPTASPTASIGEMALNQACVRAFHEADGPSPPPPGRPPHRSASFDPGLSAPPSELAPAPSSAQAARRSC